MADDWTRSPTIALWTGVGAVVAPFALWTIPWLAPAGLDDASWLTLWVGLLVVPVAGAAAVGIGLRARAHASGGSKGPAVVGIALGVVGIGLAVSMLVGLWSLSNLSELQNLSNLQNL